jgi:hypothetical protein
LQRNRESRSDEVGALRIMRFSNLSIQTLANCLDASIVAFMRTVMPGVGRVIIAPLTTRRRSPFRAGKPWLLSLDAFSFPGSYNWSLAWTLKNGQTRLYAYIRGSDPTEFFFELERMTYQYDTGGAGDYGGYFYNGSIRGDLTFIDII